MTRLLLCSLALAALPATAVAGDKAKKPNILILIADDWSYPHASGLGTKGVKTPNIDKLIKAGKTFHRAYTAAPSCTASRAAILTGRWPHALKEGGNLHGFLPAEFVCYPDLLERAGYFIGLTGKGWGPGTLEGSGRTRNPAGDRFKDFAEFLGKRKKDQPFCYWFGSQNPHRPYKLGAGVAAGLDVAKVNVPPFWPDTKEVKSDMLDYITEVMAFDAEVGVILDALQAAGEGGNTLILILSDNGMPFPRSKATLYELGVHMPLIVSWPGRCPPGSTTDAFVSYTDIAPTLLQAAGLDVPKQMQGKSFLNLVTKDKEDKSRNRVFFERERHANVRKGDLSYPSRGVRNGKWFYIRNFRPEAWPAGDPEMYFSVGPYGDIDDGPTKQAIMKLKTGNREERLLWQHSMGLRPEDELYNLDEDPYQLNNLAYDYEHIEKKNQMRGFVELWMRETGDPRLTTGGDDDRWDRYPYFGAPGGGKKKLK